MPYREPAKVEGEKNQKALLYKRPWWKIWPATKHTNVQDGQPYTWVSNKSWTLPSAVFSKQDCLHYSNKGNWVLDIWTSKMDPTIISTPGSWNWFLYRNTLQEIEDALKSNKGWKTTDEARKKALETFRRLVRLKDGELNPKGEKEI